MQQSKTIIRSYIVRDHEHNSDICEGNLVSWGDGGFKQKYLLQLAASRRIQDGSGSARDASSTSLSFWRRTYCTVYKTVWKASALSTDKEVPVEARVSVALSTEDGRQCKLRCNVSTVKSRQWTESNLIEHNCRKMHLMQETCWMS